MSVSDVSTLAALKALPSSGVAILTASPRPGWFTWTAGDFTGQADDVDVVTSDSTSIATGAWLRRNAGDPVSVLNYIDPVEHADIRSGTSSYDCTAAIRDAMADNDNVLFPDGRYTISNNLPCRDGQTVHLDPQVEIRQTATEKQIFYGSGLSDVAFFCRNALLYGQGDFFGGGDAVLKKARADATAWAASTAYSRGAFRYNDTNVYRVLVTGTSAGSGGPIGIGSSIIDGSVTWEYIGYRLASANWQAAHFYSLGQTARNSGNVYVVTAAGTSAGSGGPSGAMSGISDGSVTWNYVGAQAALPVVWGGNGHLDRAFDFTDCTRVFIGAPRIVNCGASSIALQNCLDVVIDQAKIEGTHQYSTPIINDVPFYWANFQNGIYLSHYDTGYCDRIVINQPDISGTTQGILIESANGLQPVRGIEIVAPNIHDIPGQHGFYCSSGNLQIVNPRLSNITLAGVKVQTTEDNFSPNIAGIIATGVNATNIGSSLFEIVQPTGSGSISGLKLDAVGVAVGTGLTIMGKVSDLSAKLIIKNAAAHGLVIQDPSSAKPIRNLDIDLQLTNSGQHGIVVTATDLKRVRIRPVIEGAGNANSGQAGIILAANSSVDIYDAAIVNSDIVVPPVFPYSMQYAISVTATDGKINLHGESTLDSGTSGKIYAASANAVTGYWRDYTATVTATSGTFTSVTTTAAYIERNKTVTVRADITITTAGTATGELLLPLPVNAKAAACLSAYENNVLGSSMVARVRPSDLTRVSIQPYDAISTAIASGRRFIVTGTYEAA